VLGARFQRKSVYPPSTIGSSHWPFSAAAAAAAHALIHVNILGSGDVIAADAATIYHR
jgi:hypothetical protein